MSDKRTSYRSNDRDHSQQQHKQSRHLTKYEENEQYRDKYPAFEIPTAYYQVIHVNKYASMDEMYLVINHLNDCTQFTIDTESEKSNGKLALIQIQTIPPRLPLLVMLIELAHLPSNDSKLSNNQLYSWGNLANELHAAKDLKLFNWPISALMFNIQPHFNGWYEWALANCTSSDLHYHPSSTSDVNADVTSQQLSTCTCHQPSPYRLQELWSIQKALIYAAKMFLDKSSTWNNWAGGLTAHRSILSSNRRKTMIAYAIYDCFATTYFIRPITERWTFNQLQNSRIIELFTTFKASPLPPIPSTTSFKSKAVTKNIDAQRLFNAINDDDDELEPISDDEIYLSQINVPVITTNQITGNLDDKPKLTVTLAPDEDELPDYNDDNNVPEMILQVEIHPEDELHVDSHGLVINDELNHQQVIEETNETIAHDDHQGQHPIPHQSSHQRRSKESRTRRNQKRNKVHRMHRYQYHLTRSLYSKFNLPIVKKILRQMNIRFKHVKVENEQLIIGVKQHQLQQYEQELPGDIFNRANYEKYRRRNHHHNRHRDHHHTTAQ